MLQYLLNTTAIWLISLVIFDMLLRRQSYHSYNRFYLLFTFVLGLFLPLYQWEHNSHAAYTILVHPVEQVVAVKQNIVSASSHVAITQSWQWLAIIYASGVFVALLLLAVDITRLVSFCLNGKRSAHGNWTVIETHKEHAPFSFLDLLFVSSRKLYTTDEWHMLLIHEQQHRKHIHFADLLLMQLTRLLFWFHPLVYVYNKRISLVHEYQADNASAQPPQVYGKFLVEQAMLQAAPSISHALSNSPVKNRILMLTHRSPRYTQLTKLLILPLVALFMVCFTKYDIEYQLENNKNIASTESNDAHLIQPDFASFATQPVKAADNKYGQAAYQPLMKIPGKKNCKMYLSGIPSTPGDINKHYLQENVILIAGMENNKNAKCCSSNLLWGNNYGNMSITEGYPKYAPVYLSANADNPCTQGFDLYRKEQYTHAVESYRHMQESWNDYPADNSIAFLGTLPGKSGQIILSDDPWSTNDKSPGMVPPLSIDRTIFGASAKTIFDGATAMINPGKEKTDARAVKPAKENIHRTKNIPFTP